MKRLIVNADDFGLTVKVNEAILAGHRGGIITSTTLMANGPAFDDAVSQATKFPDLGVGVHLNLVEGLTVCEPSRVPRLARGDGRFRGGPGYLLGLALRGRLPVAEIERELRSQVEKTARAGIQITHLDCHKHTQVLPQVFDAVLRLAHEFRIRAVRVPLESWDLQRSLKSGELASKLKRLKQYFQSRVMALISGDQRARARESGLCTADFFFGITETGFLDKEALIGILAALPDGTSELMCHPGIVDDNLERSPTRLLRQRETELAALLAPETRECILQEGIELINYRKVTA